MRTAMGCVGTVLICIVLWDVIKTTLLLQGAGPLTKRLSGVLWRGCLAITGRLLPREFLSFCGVGILLITIAVWVILYWAGWTLIFSTAEYAVVSAQQEVPATFWQRVYYVGFILITLGVGDFKAGNDLWEILTVLVSISGFFLVTLVITYLLPVVSSTVEQRQFALHVQAMRFSRGALLPSFGKGIETLAENLQPLTEKVCRLAQQHLAYPVLHFMQPVEARAALPPALAALDESLTLILNGGRSRPSAVENLLPLRHSLTFYLKTLKSLELPISLAEIPEPPPLLLLSELGLETGDEEDYLRKLGLIEERRRLLKALVVYTGWDWDDVSGQRIHTEIYTLEGHEDVA